MNLFPLGELFSFVALHAVILCVIKDLSCIPVFFVFQMNLYLVRVLRVISVPLLNMTSAAPLSAVLSLLSQRKEGKEGAA